MKKNIPFKTFLDNELTNALDNHSYGVGDLALIQDFYNKFEIVINTLEEFKSSKDKEIDITQIWQELAKSWRKILLYFPDIRIKQLRRWAKGLFDRNFLEALEEVKDEDTFQIRK